MRVCAMWRVWVLTSEQNERERERERRQASEEARFRQVEKVNEASFRRKLNFVPQRRSTRRPSPVLLRQRRGAHKLDNPLDVARRKRVRLDKGRRGGMRVICEEQRGSE